MQNSQRQQSIALASQYVSSCLLKHDINSIIELQSFAEQPTPKQTTTVKSEHVQNDLYKVTISVKYSIVFGIKKIVFIDLDLVGEFVITGFEGDMLDKILNIQCATMLSPFLNERMAALFQFTVFVKPLLSDLNFEEIYIKQQL